jgi:hypothetical protein
VYQPVPDLDLDPPSSRVAALPPQSRTSFPVSWAGTDQPGNRDVARYDVFVSVDGGVFQPWLSSTTETAATYDGTFGRSYAFYSVATDTSGNREPVPGTPDAFTTVNLTNRPPVFATPSNVLMNEGDTLMLALDASDPDGDRLTFMLLDAPPGLAVSASSGRIVWTTGEGHGPGSHPVTVRVQDDATPPLAITRSFLVTVNDVNAPPVLAGLGDRTLSEGQLLTLIAVASDSDLPVQQLRFSPGTGAPAGASIDAVTGRFSWRPDNTQGGRTHSLQVIVTDDGSPPFSATRSFNVIVRDTRPDFSIAIGTTPLPAGEQGSVPFTLHAGMALREVSLLLTVDGEGLVFPELMDLAPELVSADFIPVQSNRFNVRFRTRADASLQGDLPVARLGFGTMLDGHSRVVTLGGSELVGVPEPASPSLNGAVTPCRVFIVDQEPILDLESSDAQSLVLVLYARPGSYALQRRDAWVGPLPWTTVAPVEALTLRTDLPPVHLNPDLDLELFRATRVETGGLTVSIRDGTLVVEWSEECFGCRLEQATRPADQADWTPSQVVPTKKNGRLQAVFPVEPAQLYFRLRVESAK